MKNLVIEMHELIPYAINAANSGEFGEVKNVTIGGIPRAVMSSQSIKYAIRQSIAQNNLRTNYYVNEIINKCFELDSSLANDTTFVKHVLESCGIALKGVDKKKKKTDASAESNEVTMILNGVGVKSSTTEVTSRAEIADIASVLVESYNDKCDAATTQKKLQNMDRFVDLWTAAFGRMSTNALFDNMDGAVQVAMSYSVDAFLHQSDFFSVIDSLQRKYDPNNAGAANMQDKSISANVMYRYMNISIETMARNYRLLERIGSDDVQNNAVAKEFAEFVADLIVHFCYGHPVAKQNSMASMPTPAAVALFTGKNIMPLTMDNAFNKAVQSSYTKSVAEAAIDRMVNWTENDMLLEQYDSAIMWVPADTTSSKSIETRNAINNVYKYAKNDIVNMVLDYIDELKKESI